MKQFFLAILCLLAVSCSDECKDVVCGPGVCEDGLCICPTNFTGDNCESCIDGYEGDDCLTEKRTKFLGTYLVVGTGECTGGLELDMGGLITIAAKEGDLSAITATLLFDGESGVLEGTINENNIEASGTVEFSNLVLTGELIDGDIVGSIRLTIIGLADGICPITLERQ